jgi:hypothetical protein
MLKKKRNKVQKFQAVGRSAYLTLCTVFNVVVKNQKQNTTATYMIEIK